MRSIFRMLGMHDGTYEYKTGGDGGRAQVIFYSQVLQVRIRISQD